MALPSNGATVSGGQWLDAGASPGVTKVQYELTGGTLNDAVIATATPTIFGWIAGWNTTAVPNGTYTLQSVASYAGGVAGTSTGRHRHGVELTTEIRNRALSSIDEPCLRRSVVRSRRNLPLEKIEGVPLCSCSFRHPSIQIPDSIGPDIESAGTVMAPPSADGATAQPSTNAPQTTRINPVPML